MDLLGYTETTKNAAAKDASDQGARSQDLLTDTYRSLEKARKTIEGPWFPGEDKDIEFMSDVPTAPFALKAFSDNIFMGWPIRSTGRPRLTPALRTASAFQLDMAIEGKFCRGAITIGDAYIDEIAVFGMALITAVEAEKYCAHDPRIILCDPAVKVTEDCRLEPSLGRYIRTDADNRRFVNYLEVMMPGEYELAPTDEQICKHRDAVQNKLEEFHNDPRILSKYQWVAKYHNLFCDEHSNHFSMSCKIDNHSAY